VRGHADAATLAAFREELLSARKAAQVSAHLAACPRCAALEGQLAEVTTLLSRATAPPMPDALTARIQAALAAEAAARTPATAPAPELVPAMSGAAGHDGTQSANGHRPRGDTGGRKRWRDHDRSWLALRVAAVTAGVAVIAGGGYGIAQLLTTGSPAVNGAASRTGAAPAIKVKGPVSRTSAGGFNAGPASGSGSSPPNRAGTPAPVVISSGTNYQATSLGPQASAVLEHQRHNGHSSAHPGPTLAPAASQASLFPDLRACLNRVGNGQSPQLVDLAHYLGHPALIVVLPGTNGAQPKALVIAPGCSATTATVLAKATLPRSG
jgi:hypothetical protein